MGRGLGGCAGSRPDGRIPPQLDRLGGHGVPWDVVARESRTGPVLTLPTPPVAVSLQLLAIVGDVVTPAAGPTIRTLDASGKPKTPAVTLVEAHVVRSSMTATSKRLKICTACPLKSFGKAVCTLMSFSGSPMA